MSTSPTLRVVAERLVTLPDPLTVDQAAEAAGVTRQTIYNRIRKNKLVATGGEGSPLRVAKGALLEMLGSRGDLELASKASGYRYIHESSYFDPMGGIHVETNDLGEVLAVWIGTPDNGGQRLEVLERVNPLQRFYEERAPAKRRA